MTPEQVEDRSSPLAKAINAKMALAGGQMLRRRMINGRAQWWVVRPDGASVAAYNLTDLAGYLGIPLPQKPEASTVTPSTTDSSNYLTMTKAVKACGYSTWTIRRGVREGLIKNMKISPRRTVVEKESLMAWAEKHKESPYTKPRKHKRRRQAKPERFLDRLDRLDSYLERLKGTPLEIDRDVFITRVIDQALDKLGG